MEVHNKEMEGAEPRGPTAGGASIAKINAVEREGRLGHQDRELRLMLGLEKHLWFNDAWRGPGSRERWLGRTGLASSGA